MKFPIFPLLLIIPQWTVPQEKEVRIIRRQGWEPASSPYPSVVGLSAVMGSAGYYQHYFVLRCCIAARLTVLRTGNVSFIALTACTTPGGRGEGCPRVPAEAQTPKYRDFGISSSRKPCRRPRSFHLVGTSVLIAPEDRQTNS